MVFTNLPWYKHTATKQTLTIYADGCILCMLRAYLRSETVAISGFEDQFSRLTLNLL